MAVKETGSETRAQAPEGAFIQALSTGDQTEQRSLIQVRKLQNTVEDLLAGLDVWSSAPLQNATSELITTRQFPISSTRWESAGGAYRDHSRDILRGCVLFFSAP
jgi:hypothetical protein